MTAPVLSRIEIFPIKSLDGLVLDQAELLPSGALKGDRQYAILDAQGRFVNGKATPLVHRLRTTFSADLTTVTLQVQDTNQRETFALLPHRTELEAWLSNFFQQSVTVTENTNTGFPDDLNAPGPTLISTATLATVASWFPELTIAEMRRRFRTNLEIDHTPPFWEEQLYGEPDCDVVFEIGQARFAGVNPCQRCIVPTRDSQDGTSTPTFQQEFVRNRAAVLPDWAPRSRFNHFYKLALNSRALMDGQAVRIQVGDPLTCQ
ncbi:MAG TPA: MOSC N-terminal beta barrel domain-containing protein [Stenomitos sp.]